VVPVWSSFGVVLVFAVVSAAAPDEAVDVEAMGKAPVRVTGSDRYRLDADGDGWGCE
jgi:hypothetical protein